MKTTKIRTRKWIAILVASVVAILALVYAFTPLGAFPIEAVGTISHGGGQTDPWDIVRRTQFADYIVIGKVISVENRVIDVSYPSGLFDPDNGEPIIIQRYEAYAFVTIKAEKYLKDNAGDAPVELTFRDPGVGGIVFFNGIKLWIEDEHHVSNKVGDRTLFYIYAESYPKGEYHLYGGGSQDKFFIDPADNTVQSRYFESKGEPPKKLEDFEAEINAAIEKTTASPQ